MPYYPLFQASSGDLRTCPLWIRGICCVCSYILWGAVCHLVFVLGTFMLDSFFWKPVRLRWESYPKLADTPDLNYLATLVNVAKAQHFGSKKGTLGHLTSLQVSHCQRHLLQPDRGVVGVKWHSRPFKHYYYYRHFHVIDV